MECILGFSQSSAHERAHKETLREILREFRSRNVEEMLIDEHEYHSRNGGEMIPVDML